KFYTDYTGQPIKFCRIQSDGIEWLKKYQGKCKPIFLLFVDAELVHRVEGIITPTLEKHITSIMKTLKAKKDEPEDKDK
ncbi:hypothetical protein KIPB_016373, partial [Kipferlia bialata]